MVLTVIIRRVLSALLVFGVYTETGVWTAIFAGLTVWAVEQQAAASKGGVFK